MFPLVTFPLVLFSTARPGVLVAQNLLVLNVYNIQLYPPHPQFCFPQFQLPVVNCGLKTHE